jgi:hypothetical protein
MINLEHLARCLGGEVRKDKVYAPGPGHSAADRSLTVWPSSGPDGFSVHSHAGDDPIVCKDYVRRKAGLPAFQPTKRGNRSQHSPDEIQRMVMASVAAEKTERRAPLKKALITKTYDYADENGVLLYQVCRLEPKKFRQRRPDGNGGWHWDAGDRRVLYRLPELLAYPDATVFFTEGEKDADRVASLGHCATTVASGKWTDECAQVLIGRDVIILEDNDEHGRKRAKQAAEAVHGKAKTSRIVRLPGLSEKGDVSDWLDADGDNADKFVDICFAAPLWQPDQAETKDASDTSSTGDKKAKPEQTGGPKQLQTAEQPPKLFTFINIAEWRFDNVPEREWAVFNRIPLRQTCLFSGEGAAGKSLTQLYLCVAHVLARDWLGQMPEPGPAFFIDAEDDDKELHRRLAAILKHYGASFQEAVSGGLYLRSLVGEDAVLASPTKGGIVEPTALYKALLERAGDLKPRMIGIASSANVFAGNEVARPEVQQFISLLTRLAQLPARAGDFAAGWTCRSD